MSDEVRGCHAYLDSSEHILRNMKKIKWVGDLDSKNINIIDGGGLSARYSFLLSDHFPFSDY